MQHLVRPEHAAREPALITWRMIATLPSLRCAAVLALWRSVVSDERRPFQVIASSLQVDHLHFIVEARDAMTIARALCSIGTRFARGLNRLFGRTGPAIDHRYHRRDLKSPSEVAHAIEYVMSNWRKHGHAATAASDEDDPFAATMRSRAWTWLARKALTASL